LANNQGLQAWLDATVTKILVNQYGSLVSGIRTGHEESWMLNWKERCTINQNDAGVTKWTETTGFGMIDIDMYGYWSKTLGMNFLLNNARR
jgi:hypothetical protein